MWHKDIGEKLIDWSTERGIDKLESKRNDYIGNVVEELAEWQEGWNIDSEHEKIDALADIVVFSMTEMIKLGYHPDLVLLEVHREIASRTGAYSEEHGKWKKFTDEEAVSKWYKADFTDCKIKE